MNAAIRIAGEQRLAQTLAPHQMQGLRLLAKSLPELRAEIAEEIGRNPAIEDVDHPLEVPLADEERRDSDETREPDFPDDYEPARGLDEESAERRQRFFDNQVKDETLQDHLLAQLPLSDIPPQDRPLAEMLIDDIDDNGYYRGSVPDVQMAFGKTEEEVDALLRAIMDFDPPGCGARNLRECLLAQMDALDGSPARDAVEKLVKNHLEDLAAGRADDVRRSLGLSREEMAAALAALRRLDGRPGRRYPGAHDRVEYINPEIRAVRRNGRWIAETDERSLPEIKLSKKFAALLEDPSQSRETKAFVRERIAAAQAFREAIVRRQQTIRDIAQAIFDRQQEFFERGVAGLKPLTELEIAKIAGVHGTTVSRTVRDKYAATPQGTVPLRRFFVTGMKTESGVLSQSAVMERIRSVIEAENPAEPLSDDRIAAALKASGITVARRTVAKYRDRLGIPGAAARRVSG